MLLVYKVGRLVAIRDVECCEGLRLDATCPDCLPVLMLCLLLALDFLHDGKHQRGRITLGEEESGLCHCFVFHVLSIEHFGGQCDPLKNLFRLGE